MKKIETEADTTLNFFFMFTIFRLYKPAFFRYNENFTIFCNRTGQIGQFGPEQPIISLIITITISSNVIGALTAVFYIK